jgi:hypothetical protein
MGRNQKQYKKLQQQSGRGGHVYIPKGELKRLEGEGVIDLDDEIKYTLSTGTSSGRARVFIELHNAADVDE